MAFLRLLVTKCWFPSSSKLQESNKSLTERKGSIPHHSGKKTTQNNRVAILKAYLPLFFLFPKTAATSQIPEFDVCNSCHTLISYLCLCVLMDGHCYRRRMCLMLKLHSILPASVKWWILYEEVIWCLEGLEPGLVDVSTFTWSGVTFGCWAEVKAIWCLSVDPGSPSSPGGSLGPLQLPHHPEDLCPKNGSRTHPSTVAVSEASSVHRRLFLWVGSQAGLAFWAQWGGGRGGGRLL